MSLIDRADTIWRILIKKRDPLCRICGMEPTTEAHHIASRGHFATRFLLENGLGLGIRCHHENGHDRPKHFESEIRRVIGDELYDSLMERSRQVVKKRDRRFIQEQIEKMKRDYDILENGNLLREGRAEDGIHRTFTETRPSV